MSPDQNEQAGVDEHEAAHEAGFHNNGGSSGGAVRLAADLVDASRSGSVRRL